MAICRFYQQGNCRYGNACKFEHPPRGGQVQQQNYNRFGALGGQANQGLNARPAETPSYAGLTVDIIQRDLASELPQWILSCYGPGRDAPEQLWGGYPREQSPEEIRLHFMMGTMAGNPQGALNAIQSLYQNAQQHIQHALSNIPAAIQFILNGEKKHPNRIDVCKGAAGGAAPGAAFGGPANAFQQSTPAANPFGAPAGPATTGGAFGQPSALGQKPSPFGAPPSAFGQQPAQPAAASGFGQPSALGGTSAFGRPAANAFGQTSALGGKPNPFAASAQPAAGPAFGQSAFGQPAALGAQPSPFGAPAAAGGAFGAAQPTQQTNNVFGQPAQPPAQSAFGQTSTAQPASGAFGQPAAASPFGQPAAGTANVFGQPQQQQQQQPQQPSSNVFGAPGATPAAPVNAFGQPATASPFGATAPTSATTNPFGQLQQQPQPQPPSQFPPAATAAPTRAAGQGPYGPNATRQHPDLATYSAANGDGTLRMFKGKPVVYEAPKSGTGKPVAVVRNFDGSTARVWMPLGAPAYTAETEAENAEVYEDEGVQRQWRVFVGTGRFEGGVMPDVPPKREWCMWDF